MPAVAHEGTKGICRNCNRPVVLQKQPTSYGGWAYRPTWRHDRQQENEDDRRQNCLDDLGQNIAHTYAQPKEWCITVKNNGDTCHKAVKHENISQGLYACGWHLKDAVAAKEREKARAEAEERRKVEEEIEAWERSVYLEDEEALELLIPNIKEFADPTSSRCEWPSSKRGFYFKLMAFDLHELRVAIDGLIERIRGEGSTD